MDSLNNSDITLADIALTASQNVSRAHMLDMAVLGAVISLCLMCRITAAPLDPLFMHFYVHRCENINMIHSALLEE